MPIDVASVAKLAQESGRQAVIDEMDARDRYSPWEVSEAWLRIAICQRLRLEFRREGSTRFRIHDEYAECDISNIESEDSHPIDIVVLYPLLEGKNPWDYCPAVGVIEIKKNFLILHNDAKRLRRLAAYPPGNPPLKWVLQVLFINGLSEDVVLQHSRNSAATLANYGLQMLTNCEPKKASDHPGNAAVGDRWFDIVCYGRAV
jgi:hypothetical protein